MLARDIAAKAQADPAFEQQLKTNPIGTLLELPDALRTDVWVYRFIVMFLGVVAAGGLALVAVLVIKGDTPPDIFTAAISASIGALAGMLVPPPQTNS